MGCERFESLIGLYVEGDLSADEQRRVEAHLGACAACAELAEGLAASQAAVRGLREEEVDDAVLAAVRRRVMAEVGARRTSWPWAYALAAGLAVVVLAIGLWPRPAVPPPPVAPVLRLPAPEVAKSPLPPPAPRPSEPLLVKMFTDDPDVVIYWIIDRKNGESI